MTAVEFSSEFDILYNNTASNQSPGLTEYEKSVFLTKALDEIVKNNFTSKPNGNKYLEGVEDSAKRYSDFSCLITTLECVVSSSENTIDARGLIVNLPANLMITLNERFKIGSSEYLVVPITLTEYQRLMSRPSQDPLKRLVWKLMGNSTSGNGSIEIISHWKDSRTTENKLVVRYVRHPYPIILEDLTAQSLTINGKATPYSGGTENQACELAKELHPEILQRAVELAKIFYTGQPADIVNSGQRSE